MPCPPGQLVLDPPHRPACRSGLAVVYHEHDPYDGLEPRALDLQGWSPGEAVYANLSRRAQAEVIIEVGVWKGLSAAHLARSLKLRKRGVLFAVDTWLGAAEFWARTFSRGARDPTRDLLWDHGYPSVFRTFLSNVVHLGLREYIVPFPSTSSVAATVLTWKGVRADVVHIDAAHECARPPPRLWPPVTRTALAVGPLVCPKCCLP
mmetsp:Transcript_54806/g.150834  ORF Transcript_54806/g.150834 Transcript_54806/m.150834 type:complete len:206 (+) Transcript_54806:24-641(+)